MTSTPAASKSPLGATEVSPGESRSTSLGAPPGAPLDSSCEREPRDGDALMARHVLSRLEPGGAFLIRRVGALHGLFWRGAGPDTPVGFVHAGALYLKAGPEGVTRFIACGMRPFRPGPRQPLRGYWRVPLEVLADDDALRDWAGMAADVVRRFGKRARRPGPRRRRRSPRDLT